MSLLRRVRAARSAARTPGSKGAVPKAEGIYMDRRTLLQRPPGLTPGRFRPDTWEIRPLATRGGRRESRRRGESDPCRQWRCKVAGWVHRVAVGSTRRRLA